MKQIIKIKEWIYSRKPQFEFVSYKPSGSTTVKRLSDGKLIERFKTYNVLIKSTKESDLAGVQIIDIMSFRKDLIKVECRFYKAKLTNEIQFVKSRTIKIDDLVFI